MMDGWSPFAIYAFIFFAKYIEVAINTTRLVFSTRGNRIAAAILATAGITIWVVVISVVLSGITEDPLRAVFYGLAFVLGIPTGILLEEKLALGLAQIEIIAGHEIAHEITTKLRELKYRVTTYNCEGLHGEKVSIIIKIHRKDIPATIELLNEYPNLFVTITDIRKLSIGTIHRSILPQI